ncbi:TrmH family RNA methyltransferase [Acetobacterium tundrae]|uniref:RNA methyltransferase n=1 Tax=Acetobacterium tundrae TaxID=132932 RepID=A0ABR6WNR6_9FIRM|nr:RNA methyltransferase [Acetobacterium tundrae]MBC3797989.1 RNA methyltransferase [Acetobacterium tundrae]
MHIEINSKNNEQLKYLRKLGNKSFRDHENTFFIEGTKLFLEAFASHLNFRQVFITQQWLETQDALIKDALDLLTTQEIPVFMVKETIFNSISTMKQPEGIICTLNKMSYPKADYGSYILLEDIQDPYNVGTIIRTADAAGINCVITSLKTADIYNEKVLRGSMGSVFHLPIYQVESLTEYAIALKNEKVQLIGTSLNGTSLWHRDPINMPFALVMGNESRGMSSELMNLCDVLLKIPILGKAESLNVATAAGIIMYDISK